MPPTSRRTKKNTHAKNKKHTKKQTRLRSYKTHTNSAKNSNSLLRIRTLLPKELTVSIQYRQLIQFASMGSSTDPGGLFSPCLFKINLLDPCAPLGPASDGIYTVIDYGGNTTIPNFTTLNSTHNLGVQLNDYMDKYRYCVVVGSKSNVRIQAVANQEKVGSYLTNEPAQGAQGDAYPYDMNHMPYLKTNNAEKDGELYCWTVKQRGQGNLVTNNQGLNINEVRTKVPGAKMRKHNAFLNGTSSKAVRFTSKYTPKFLGIKDWRDNIDKIKILPDGSARPTGAEQAFQYVGVSNRFGAVQGYSPANVSVEIAVDYNIRFVQRLNDPLGGDNPIPHADNVGRADQMGGD